MNPANYDQWYYTQTATNGLLPNGGGEICPDNHKEHTLHQQPLPRRTHQAFVEDVRDESWAYYHPLHPQTMQRFFEPLGISNSQQYHPAYTNRQPQATPNNQWPSPFTPPPLLHQGSSLSSADSIFSVPPTPPSVPLMHDQRSPGCHLSFGPNDPTVVGPPRKKVALGESTTMPLSDGSWHISSAASPNYGFLKRCNPLRLSDQFPSTWAYQVSPAWGCPVGSSLIQDFHTDDQRSHFTFVTSKNSRTSSGTRKVNSRSAASAARKTANKSSSDQEAAFQSSIKIELERRSKAEKTIQSIKTDKARLAANNKESVRRIEWAKSMLLDFPSESAMMAPSPGKIMETSGDILAAVSMLGNPNN